MIDDYGGAKSYTAFERGAAPDKFTLPVRSQNPYAGISINFVEVVKVIKDPESPGCRTSTSYSNTAIYTCATCTALTLSKAPTHQIRTDDYAEGAGRVVESPGGGHNLQIESASLIIKAAIRALTNGRRLMCARDQ